MRIVHRRLSLALALAALLGCAPFSNQAAPPVAGAMAPSFALPLLDGGAVELGDLKGKVVIVNFWATWCPPCLDETPRLQRWYEEYRVEGLIVLGVNTLFRDSLPEVLAFADEYRVTYPLPIDEEGNVSRQWMAQQLPRSYIIDREGIVRFVRIGELTEDDFAAHALPLLR